MCQPAVRASTFRTRVKDRAVIGLPAYHSLQPRTPAQRQQLVSGLLQEDKSYIYPVERVSSLHTRYCATLTNSIHT